MLISETAPLALFSDDDDDTYAFPLVAAVPLLNSHINNNNNANNATASSVVRLFHNEEAQSLDNLPQETPDHNLTHSTFDTTQFFNSQNDMDWDAALASSQKLMEEDFGIKSLLEPESGTSAVQIPTGEPLINHKKRKINETNDATQFPVLNAPRAGKTPPKAQEETRYVCLMQDYRKELLTIHKGLTTHNISLFKKVDIIVEQMIAMERAVPHDHNIRLMPNTQAWRMQENKNLLQLLVLNEYGFFRNTPALQALAWALAIPEDTLRHYVSAAKNNCGQDQFILPILQRSTMQQPTLDTLQILNAKAHAMPENFPPQNAQDTFTAACNLINDESNKRSCRKK